MQIPLQINKVNGVPIYLQIGEQIRLLIHQGRLEPGQLMPTVRSLAVDLEINSNTVARVYHDLQNEGLLVLRRGIGTFVSDRPKVKPLTRKDQMVLEKKVDGIVEMGRKMGLTAVELFQLVETRWEE